MCVPRPQWPQDFQEVRARRKSYLITLVWGTIYTKSRSSCNSHALVRQTIANGYLLWWFAIQTFLLSPTHPFQFSIIGSNKLKRNQIIEINKDCMRDKNRCFDSTILFINTQEQDSRANLTITLYYFLTISFSCAVWKILLMPIAQVTITKTYSFSLMIIIILFLFTVKTWLCRCTGLRRSVTRAIF